MAPRLSIIETIYDQRAPNYDDETGFHSRQHADYLKWMALSPGLKVLDLACGTGGITIPAKRAVGPSGKVVGVDISSRSLEIARKKADRDALDITFVHHDISDLEVVDGVSGEQFDVITCAAAFVLLEHPEAAMRNWAKLLKVGGRVIIDVLTKDTMVAWYVLDAVAKEMGIPLVYDRMRFDSLEKVQMLLSNAGLDGTESFMCESYDQVEVLADKPGEMFDGLIDRKGWSEAAYLGFRDPMVRAAAKDRFCDKLKGKVDANGKIMEQIQFLMGIGRKL